MRRIPSIPRTLRPVLVQESVAGVLRDTILSAELRPGDRIVELRWARQLGVAQASVREALRRLEGEGFVTRRANRGAYVTSLSEAQVRDIYRVRIELEGLAAELFAEHRNHRTLRSMRRITDRMEEAAEKLDVRRFYELDLQFHSALWEGSKNPYLEQFLRSIVVPLFTFVILRIPKGTRTREGLLRSTGQHRETVGALERADPLAAKQFVARHMKEFASATQALMAQRGAVASDKGVRGSAPSKIPR